MSNTNALDYFHVLLAAYEALHDETSLVEVQKVTEELRAMNSAQPMLTALDAKIRQMCTVREMLIPASDEDILPCEARDIAELS
jgi:hypothetical protein